MQENKFKINIILNKNISVWLVLILLNTCRSSGTVLSEINPVSTADNSTLNQVRSLTYAEDKGSEKVTIVFDRKIYYKSRFLDKNSKKNIPYRLYLDLINSKLPGSIKNIQCPESSNIKRIRIAQKDTVTTRIVLEIENIIYREDYKIYKLDSPPRIVIELLSNKKYAAFKKSKSKPIPSRSSRESGKQKKGISTEENQSQQISSRKTEIKFDECIIVIDPGHGGRDPGAVGYNNILEKDVCLPIALELKKMLDEKLKCKTILTRDRDRFVSIEERAQIANSNQADFFISIHANSHEDERLTGIETYYLNFSSDATARKVAARENFTTPEKIGDLEMILFDLLHNGKINKSSILAGYVHNALVKELSNKFKSVRNLGVKHAPMRVLIDVDMPGILIEAAFISNPSEAKLLTSKSYHQALARAILDGIHNLENSPKTASYYREN